MRKSHNPDGTLNPNYIWLLYEKEVLENRIAFQAEYDLLMGNVPLIGGIDQDGVRTLVTVDESEKADRIDTLKTYITDLDAVLNAPYEEKGRRMCNVYEIDNQKTKNLHVHYFLKPCVKLGILARMLWE